MQGLMPVHFYALALGGVYVRLFMMDAPEIKGRGFIARGFREPDLF